MISLAPIETRQATWLTPALACCAAALWIVFARPVDPGALGLIIALLLAFVVLSAAFVLELRAPRPRIWVLAGSCLLAVAAVYGLPSIVEPVARLPVAWLHAGWSEYIAGHGEVLPGFDARFSWPAFFAVAAWVSEIAGAEVTSLLAWAPPVFTGLTAIGVHADRRGDPWSGPGCLARRVVVPRRQLGGAGLLLPAGTRVPDVRRCARDRAALAHAASESTSDDRCRGGGDAAGMRAGAGTPGHAVRARRGARHADRHRAPALAMARRARGARAAHLAGAGGGRLPDRSPGRAHRRR